MKRLLPALVLVACGPPCERALEPTGVCTTAGAEVSDAYLSAAAEVVIAELGAGRRALAGVAVVWVDDVGACGYLAKTGGGCTRESGTLVEVQRGLDPYDRNVVVVHELIHAVLHAETGDGDGRHRRVELWLGPDGARRDSSEFRAAVALRDAGVM